MLVNTDFRSADDSLYCWVAPSRTFLASARWRRTTTLVLRGDTWKLLEYCQDATLLGNKEEKIPNPASVILLRTISRDDWLSPEELGLVIESPQNIGGLSQPQLNPQVPQVFRIEVHCVDRSRECDDADGQQARHPCMDWAVGASKVPARESASVHNHALWLWRLMPPMMK